MFWRISITLTTLPFMLVLESPEPGKAGTEAVFATKNAKNTKFSAFSLRSLRTLWLISLAFGQELHWQDPIGIPLTTKQIEFGYTLSRSPS